MSRHEVSWGADEFDNDPRMKDLPPEGRKMVRDICNTINQMADQALSESEHDRDEAVRSACYKSFVLGTIFHAVTKGGGNIAPIVESAIEVLGGKDTPEAQELIAKFKEIDRQHGITKEIPFEPKRRIW